VTFGPCDLRGKAAANGIVAAVSGQVGVPCKNIERQSQRPHASRQEITMRISIRSSQRVRLALAVAACACLLALGQRLTVAQQAPAANAERRPQYDASGQLRLPDDYRRWVLVGSSVGLTYAPGASGHQMFGTTLMEPSAYDHYVRTGTFREGTMFALVMQGIGSGSLPSRSGQFASDLHLVEMAVKDSKRTPDVWAYYDFGGPMGGGYRATAAPRAKASCYACHVEHAQTDNVFTQFYGLLNDARSAASSK
jgi:hypothetical protein